MKAYWLPGISRYRRTKAEAQAESDVSPYEETNLPDRHQETIDFLNGMIEQHERNVKSVELLYDRDEAIAKEMGYETLPQALRDLRRLREGGTEKQADATKEVVEKPVEKPTAAAPPTTPSGDVVEAILALDETRVLDALGASLDRMHELVGYKGWHLFARKTLSWGGGSQSTDRGLGMLVMAGLASLGRDDVAAGKGDVQA